MDWINSPLLKNMEPAKLELFKLAMAQTTGKSGNNLASIMMSLIMNANKKGIRFTPEEISLILSAMKEGKTAEEQQNIDKMVRLVMNMMQKQKK